MPWWARAFTWAMLITMPVTVLLNGPRTFMWEAKAGDVQPFIVLAAGSLAISIFSVWGVACVRWYLEERRAERS